MAQFGEESRVLKGDLSSSGIADILEQLARDTATGCLHLVDGATEEALVYLRAGEVYAMSVPGRGPALGARLVSAGALAPESLLDAMEVQRTELPDWRLSELLVHMGYVEQQPIEAALAEQLLERCAVLVEWTAGQWWFRRNERTRDDVGPPTAVAELLDQVMERSGIWGADEPAQLLAGAVAAVAEPARGKAGVPVPPDAWDPTGWDPGATVAPAIEGDPVEHASRAVSAVLEDRSSADVAGAAGAPPAASSAMPAGWLTGDIADAEAADVRRQQRIRSSAAQELAAASAAAQAEYKARQAADKEAERAAAEAAESSELEAPTNPVHPAYVPAARVDDVVEETDTASLMWELSTLGREEKPRPSVDPPAPRTPSRPAAVPDRVAKKRKGRFGR